MITPSGEASCGNSTEIFSTDTPSSMCNEVSDRDHDGRGDDDDQQSCDDHRNCFKRKFSSHKRLGTTSASVWQEAIWKRRKKRWTIIYHSIAFSSLHVFQNIIPLLFQVFQNVTSVCLYNRFAGHMEVYVRQLRLEVEVRLLFVYLETLLLLLLFLIL